MFSLPFYFSCSLLHVGWGWSCCPVLSHLKYSSKLFQRRQIEWILCTHQGNLISSHVWSWTSLVCFPLLYIFWCQPKIRGKVKFAQFELDILQENVKWEILCNAHLLKEKTCERTLFCCMLQNPFSFLYHLPLL